MTVRKTKLPQHRCGVCACMGVCVLTCMHAGLSGFLIAVYQHNVDLVVFNFILLGILLDFELFSIFHW